jgi:hypothetical protein
MAASLKQQSAAHSYPRSAWERALGRSAARTKLNR